MAAGQRAQCRVHEERTQSFCTGFDSGTHGPRPNAGCSQSRGRGHCPRNAVGGSAHGAGSANQCPAGTLQLGGRWSGSAGNEKFRSGIKVTLCGEELDDYKFSQKNTRHPAETNRYNREGVKPRWLNLKSASSAWKRLFRSWKREKCLWKRVSLFSKKACISLPPAAR